MPSVIKCIVKGNKIEEVLLALEPFVLEPPVVQVITDKATSPAKVTSVKSPITVVFDYVNALKKQGTKTITTKSLKNEVMAHGGQHNSYSYGLKQLINMKRLRKTDQPSTYEIL